MLYPVGFTPEDFKKPLIGIASTWSNVTPCNMHIDKLALEAEKGANAGGGKAIVFNTITVSDGISNGQRRHEVLARLARGHRRLHRNRRRLRGMDGYVAIGGCDKNMPGAMIAIARMNRPAVFVYGGTILPGCLTNPLRQLVERRQGPRHRFRLRSRRPARRGQMSDEESARRRILRDSRPGLLRRHVHRQHHGQRD
jgi:dihydroxyacid dehydratase/phosphogluconate dehydratase